MESIIYSKTLFAAWCALHAGGYALADTADTAVQALCHTLADADFGPSVQAWAAAARTDMVAVNPWYPRASDVSVACFLGTGQRLWDFLRFFRSPDADDDAFAGWIAKLPDILRQVQEHPAFERLWQNCLALYQARYAAAGAAIAALQARLTRLPFGAGPRLCFVPNLLQSPFLTDYVLTDDTLYLIAAAFAQNGAVHEYLHAVLHPYQPLLTEALQRRSIDAFVDVPAMRALGYMPDDTPASAAHALEDCVVRALSGLLENADAQPAFWAAMCRQGFTAVPRMAAALQGCAWMDTTPQALLYRLLY